jgi:Phytanoyl-CoA dioxygenase (PhyH)
VAASTIVEVHDPATFLLNRALYCWSAACVELLESPWIERIAHALIGPHRLHELAAQGAVPAPHLDSRRAERWHRDQDLESAPGPDEVRLLWFMVPVDPFTTENGATWIVPGSHRLPDRDTPVGGEGVVRFPTARQITSEPGDLVVVNPLALHTWGHNRTDRPRRMINAMIAAPEERTVLDHWKLAGPTLRAAASGRVRYLLRSPEPPLEPDWPALPPGWAT